MDPRISSVRDAAVAGQFYPGNAGAIEKAVRDQLAGAESVVENAIGVMAPHAGYMYSGAVAGAVYGSVKVPGKLVVLGPNHTGIGSRASVMAKGRWRMPLGDVPIDEDLAREMLAGSQVLSEDATAHVFEHSIEVQLPFLQYLHPGITFVPISLMVNDAASCSDIGAAVAAAISRRRDRVLIVASSDMSHYERQNEAERKDMMALEKVLELDPDGLLETVDENSISMCGVAPTAAMLYAARELGASRGTLIKYQTSGDVTGDINQVVGYAGVVVS